METQPSINFEKSSQKICIKFAKWNTLIAEEEIYTINHDIWQEQQYLDEKGKMNCLTSQFNGFELIMLFMLRSV